MTKSQRVILSALAQPEGPRFVGEFMDAGLDVTQLSGLVILGLAELNLYDHGLAYRITEAGRRALRREHLRIAMPWWRRAWRWVTRR